MEIIIYKKLKNCTFTQTQLDINGGVGILLGFMVSKLLPSVLFFDWYVYAFAAIIFAIPLFMIIIKQFSEGKSLAQKKLSEKSIRWME